MNIAFFHMQVVYFYPRRASDHTRRNCNGGSRKTIQKEVKMDQLQKMKKIFNLGLLETGDEALE